MAHQQQNPSLLLDTLYCEEENWEDVRENSFDDDEEEEIHFSDCISPKSPFLQPNAFLWEEEQLSSLFLKEEEQNQVSFVNFETNPSLVEARKEPVEWILKVVSHYSFTALTAVLAVNYLDRFLLSCQFPREKKPWMNQLAAVACVSLAAKVEETHVPLLLDLQVAETKYVFEAKTIQRMEILVLSSLQWKMNPVTPLAFLDYITSRLGLKNHLCWEVLRRCECLLLSIISDCRVMSYLPSVMATATMLHVINGVEPCLGVEFQDQLLAILGIDKVKVDECFKLIQELASRIQFYLSNKRKFGSLPGSPKGVMDVSFSSDSSNDSWAVATVASVSSSPEPLSKKRRDHATTDILRNIAG